MGKLIHCKYASSDNELLTSFKHKMLRLMIILLVIASTLSGLYYTAGFGHISNGEHNLRYAHAFLGLIFYFILTFNKDSYTFVSYGLIFMTLFIFSYAFYHAANTEIRLLWFLVITMAAFITNGTILGVMTAVLSMLSLIYVNNLYDLKINNFTFLTIGSSLVITSLMLYYFTKKIEAFSRNLSEQNARLDRLASVDPLTGMMNRRVFLEMADKYLHQSYRQDEKFYFLMLDIDHFKSINDSYGHKEGDNVLIRYAKVIHNILRENDLFGRLGGEEFGVVILEKDRKNALHVAEKIRMAIESEVYEVGDKTLPITMSIGVAFGYESATLEEVMHASDIAMYKAKTSGRNRVCVSEECYVN